MASDGTGVSERYSTNVEDVLLPSESRVVRKRLQTVEKNVRRVERQRVICVEPLHTVRNVLAVGTQKDQLAMEMVAAALEWNNDEVKELLERMTPLMKRSELLVLALDGELDRCLR